MALVKRIGFFLAMNLAIMIIINIIISAFGLEPHMSANGINYQSLAVFCLLWGMIGSFISLAISKWMAKRMMGVQIVDGAGQFSALVHTVHTLSKKAGLPKMPEVGVYDSPEINAFATGPSRANSLVAVSTGLLQKMNTDEVEGVLAHEVSHIANGDMVTTTVLQGVLNAFVMFLSHIIMHFIDQFTRDENGRGGLGFLARFLVYNLLYTVFGIGAAFISSYFSRTREFRADAGAAKLAGKEKMRAALQKLQTCYDQIQAVEEEKNYASMKISSKRSVMAMLSTHPTLERRIEALDRLAV